MKSTLKFCMDSRSIVPKKPKTGISAAEAKFVYETFRDHDMDKDGKISFGEMQNKFSMIQEGNM